MVKFLLQRPVAVIMSTIAFIVLGIVASFRLPVSLMPEIDIPEITVHYTWDNASINEVENTLTSGLRGQLQQIPKLTEIQSESKEGSGLITMKFEYGTSLDYAFIEVNQKVDACVNSFPKEVQRPTIIKASTSDLPVFYININLKEYDSEEKFLEFCEFTDAVLKKRLEQLPDVAMADISGMYSPELYIFPDEAKLRSLKITQDQLKSAIDNNNQVSGSLAVKDGYYQYSISFASQITSPEELENVYLNINGRLLQIKDIARSGIRPREKRGIFFNGAKQSLCLAVIKQSNARMSEMKEKVTGLLDQFREEYPDVEFSVSRDQAQLLNYSIDNLVQSLWQGILLAIVAMLFFLQDARSPVIIAISIPVSVIICMLFFQLIGISINTISLSGLILGVGMMVDNSIITIDNINQHRMRGKSLFQACLDGTNEIITPLLSSVLTTCAIFVPLIFMSGIAGALFYDQAMAVAIGLFVSLAVSITIVPVVFHLLFIHAKEGKVTRFIRQISFKHLENYYTNIFHFIFHHRLIAMSGCFTILVLGFVLALQLRLERMPTIDTNEMILRVDWNSSIHIDENEHRVKDIIERFSNKCEEISCHTGEKMFFLNREKNQNINEAEFYIRTLHAEELKQVISSIREYVKADYPGAKVDITKVDNLFEQLFKDNDVPLVVYLSGESRRGGPELDSVNTFIEYLDSIMPTLQLDKPSTSERIVVEILPDRLALYKVNQGALINVLEKNISKMNIGKLNTGSRYVPIVITGEEKTILDIIRSSFVSNSDQLDIPVSALTRMERKLDYKSIIGRKEGVVVPLNIYHIDDSTEQIIQTIKKEAGNRNLNTTFDGQYFSGQETLWEMVVVVIVAILMLYFILAAQFESLTLPIILLVEIPLDVAFTLLILWLSGISLNLMSMIGIVVMSGIVINDSILKIDTIIRLQRSGLALEEAIHEGGVRRLKPILMTSLTTIFALVPMLWGNDIGTQLQRPMSITLIAGMTVGTFVSLFIIPLFYYYLERIFISRKK